MLRTTSVLKIKFDLPSPKKKKFWEFADIKISFSSRNQSSTFYNTVNLSVFKRCDWYVTSVQNNNNNNNNNNNIYNNNNSNNNNNNDNDKRRQQQYTLPS